MDSRTARAPLSRNERIAAIREKAQRHIYHSARVFTPPPEESNNNLVPIPSLLAVACTAALANQAQGQEAKASNFDELNNALQNSNITHIKLNEDIYLKPADHFQPIKTKGINISGHFTNVLGDNDWYGLGFKDNPGLYFLENTGKIDFLDLMEASGSTPSSMGGAIYAFKELGEIFRVNFYSNVALDNGGGIFANYFNSKMYSSNFIKNKAKNSGGAIFFFDFNGTIEGGSFRENSSELYGGALYLKTKEQLNENGNIINSIFEKNHSISGGGAITAISGLYNSSLRYDHAEWNYTKLSFYENFVERGSGGAMDLIGYHAIKDNIFIENSASRGGGAIYLENGSSRINLENTIFIRNKSMERGGAIYSEGVLNITGNTIFYGNENAGNYEGIHALGRVNIGGDHESKSGIKGWDPNGSEDIMMFDPIATTSVYSSIYSPSIEKTRHGKLFLGGVSEITGGSFF